MVCGLPPFYTQNKQKLYEMIRDDDIDFMDNVELKKRKASPEIRDLISRLLVKDPSKRLGSSERDVEEIKEHPFFAKFIPNWDEVLRKGYTPPYIPNLKSEDDVNHFDEAFTSIDPFSSFTPPVDPNQPMAGRKLSADVWSDFSLDPDDHGEHDPELEDQDIQIDHE